MPTPDRCQVARVAALAATWVTIGVHIYLANDHLMEKTYIGVLFLVGAALLVPTVHALARGLSTSALVWGTAINLGMAGAFVLSRTTGLPGGFRETWTSDYGLGLVALSCEITFLLATAVVLLPSALATEPLRRGARGEWHADNGDDGGWADAAAGGGCLQ